MGVAPFLSTLLPYLDSYFAASSFAAKVLRLRGLSPPDELGELSLPSRANTLDPEILPSAKETFFFSDKDTYQ